MPRAMGTLPAPSLYDPEPGIYIPPQYQPEPVPVNINDYTNPAADAIAGYTSSEINVNPPPLAPQSLMNYPADANPVWGQSESGIGLPIDTSMFPSASDEYDALYNNPALNGLPVANQISLPGMDPPPIPQMRPPRPIAQPPAFGPTSTMAGADYVSPPMPMAPPPMPIGSAAQGTVDVTQWAPADQAAIFGYDRPSDAEIMSNPSPVWYDPTQFLPDLGSAAYY